MNTSLLGISVEVEVDASFILYIYTYTATSGHDDWTTVNLQILAFL